MLQQLLQMLLLLKGLSKNDGRREPPHLFSPPPPCTEYILNDQFLAEPFLTP